jgi:hypothetical protein
VPPPQAGDTFHMSLRLILTLAALCVSAALIAWLSLPGSSVSSANVPPSSLAIQPADSATAPISDGLRDVWETTSGSIAPDDTQPAAGISYDAWISQLQAKADRIPAKDLAAAVVTAIKELRTHQTPEAEEIRMRILQRWAELDPSAAAAEVQSIPAPARTEAIQRVIGCWADQDIASAAAWANQQTDSGDRYTALMALAHCASFDDPAFALTLASQSSVRREDFDIVSQAASSWAATSPEQAAAWSRQIPDPELRQEVAASIAVRWADQDPTAAAQWLLANKSNWKQQRNTVFGIVQRLALRDPAAATRWAEQFPEDLRDSVLNELKRISERQEPTQY